MRALAAASAALLLALAMPFVALGAEPASQTALESEVMCPVCGTLLELAESPQAQSEKAFIARQIAAGKTAEQVKDALVAEYGRSVLALPDDSGFSLSAYVVPIVAFLAAAVALGLGVWRWRRAGGDPPSGRPPSAAGPSRADAERLDEDLARYDL
jgi:cytochrome c-type biogenesis protein CcmH/NrfF